MYLSLPLISGEVFKGVTALEAVFPMLTIKVEDLCVYTYHEPKIPTLNCHDNTGNPTIVLKCKDLHLIFRYDSRLLLLL